ncbi:hypothetical protein FA95DRAFT_1613651 [Auriscalpium vulgare]|uniref:Uncharacterized protein n=1 Tax=Auriscalpium vulgare TaxID=40419 RepID=A0ACB8R1U7_9AGAM|nr:hypothetical protein FA95DRAFT_1613651 [Auriscalpium vulgare]
MALGHKEITPCLHDKLRRSRKREKALQEGRMPRYKVRGGVAKKHTHPAPKYVAMAVDALKYAQGAWEPKELNLDKNKEVMYCLKKNCHVRRIIGFESSVVALNSPKIYRKYEHMVDRFLEHHEGLSLPHDNSIFATTTFNFGPHATTKAHRGGHLVLWQMGVIIEFPSGSTAAIPSGSVPHGNTNIQDGETRACITQYTSVVLFWYIEYGFCSQKAFKKEDAKGFAEVYS